jgi:superfamily II RNA helicase
MKSSSSYLKIFNKLEKATELPKNEIAYEFPYELDNFQKQGIYGIHNNENVLITAHTGSGKTVLAIYAIANALKNNKKCIYTSPTKSLSNQKYSEFKEKFESVGIFTGDIKMNPDAQCIIMTTEILRNILYKENNTQQSTSKLLNIDINEIGAVVFDEVHYINDPDRGKVWEESIVLLPSEITLVMLSATIDKPDEFASWIGDIKQKPIHLIPTSHRVVPLKHYYWKGTQFINNNGKDEVSWAMVEILSASGEFKNYNLMNNKFKVYDVNKIMDKLIDYLVDEKYTPALFFKFSRKKCEDLCRMVRKSLLTHEEISEIEKIFNFQMRNYKKIYEILPQYQSVYAQLLKGVVYHHSGLIPILKEIIEILYSKGLIKILFATETFSIGVNMPTKTVLFTDLDKYDNKGKRFLRSDEYLQMSGRAGRRGLDEFGSVILLPTFDLLSEIELKSIMIGKSPSVKSKFNLSYQFVLKSMLLETKNINDIISNTLIRNEYKKMSNGLQHRNEELEILLEKYAFNEDELKVLKRYDDIYNKMNSTIFTLKKKDYQKLELEKKNIESEKDFQNSYKRYQEYTTLLKEFDSNNNSIDHNEMDILNQIDIIKSVLKDYDYIKDDNTLTNDVNSQIKEHHLTKKGIIASAVNDCNELLFTEMIFQGYLDNLTFPEIIGLLSTFINEKDGEDKYLNDLNISDNLYDAIKNLQKLSIKLEDNESNKGLFLKMDYNLYLDFIEPAYIWASGGSIQEIYSVTAIYDGNFVKAIMRINNICDNLMDICKTIERYDICAKLENSTSILIRDITTINSLYVN